MNGDYLYEAMGRIGADLVEVAEKHPFPKSPWRRILPLAACLAVVLGLTLGLLAVLGPAAPQPMAAPSNRPIVQIPDRYRLYAREGLSFWIDDRGVLYGHAQEDYTHQISRSDAYYKPRRKLMTGVAAVYPDAGGVTLALKTNGELWGWGTDYRGLLIESDTERDYRSLLMENVVSAGVGWSHCAAVQQDGSLWLWGTLCGEVRQPLKVLNGIAAVSVCGDMTFAISRDGTAYVWCNSSSPIQGEFTVEFRPIAENIIDAAWLGGSCYQLLTAESTVLQFDPETEDHSLPVVARQVQSVWNGGLIKTDHSLWRWSTSETDSSLRKLGENAACAHSDWGGYIMTLFLDGAVQVLDQAGNVVADETPGAWFQRIGLWLGQLELPMLAFLGSFLAYTAALALPLISLFLERPGKARRWLALASCSACVLALALKLWGLAAQIRAREWSILLATMDGALRTALILTVCTGVLNLLAALLPQAARRRTATILLWTGVAAALVLVLIPKTAKIQQKLQVYEYALGQTEPLAVHQVTIDGLYSRSYLIRDSFSGTLSISGFPDTQDRRASITFDAGESMAMISYLDSYGQPLSSEIGQIYTVRDFSQLVLIVFEGTDREDGGISWNWTSDGGRVLCTNAPDYQSLLDVFTQVGFPYEPAP